MRQVSLIEVVIEVLEEGWLLLRVLRIVLYHEFVVVKLLLPVDLGLFVHICEFLILLLDSSEFDTSCLSSLVEARFSIRESDHELGQVLLGKTVAVRGLLNTRLVCFTGTVA